MRLRLPLLILPLFLCLQAYATHIVGGEFQLQHLYNNEYRLSLNIYFDEIYGKQNQKDLDVYVTIFEKGTDRAVRRLTLSRKGSSLLNYTNVACTSSDLRTSKLVYYHDIGIPPHIYNNPAGYYVAWERCCRNNVVSNITKEAGTTIYMEFPPVVKNGKAFKNSSPILTPPPSDYACQGELFYYDFGSTDADGDHLVYDMVAPLSGFSTPSNSRPTALSGPYPEVNWLPGYNKENQILGNPVVNVDRTTGWLTVNPKYVGLFVFGVRVQEFRNGVKIGEVRRDFQLLVKACGRNDAPQVSIVHEGNPTPYIEGQTLRIGPTDSRCIKIIYTDPDKNEPISLDVTPVNFTNNNIYSLSGTTSGVVNTNSGNKALEALLCLEQCFDTSGKTYQLDLVVTDDGDQGCSLPKKAALRLSLIIETGLGSPPNLSLSSPTRTYEVTEGDLISFDVTGTDADKEEVTVSAAGRGFNLHTQNITFKTESGTGRVTSPFTWQIDQKAFDQPSYLIDLLVTSTSACGSLLTKTETIEVRPRIQSDIENNTIQSDQIICAGEIPATLTGSLPTGGNGSYQYTWEVSTTDAESGFALAPGNPRQQHYTPLTLTQTSWFRRKVSSGLKSETTSAPVMITVKQAVENNIISSAQVICANNAPLLLTGTEPRGGGGTHTFQWEYSITGPSSGFKPVSEASKGKEKDYQPGVLHQTTWYRRVVISPPCPPLPSEAIEVTVMPAINWNTITGDQVVCEGSRPQKLTGVMPVPSKEGYTYTWEYSTTSAEAGFSPAPALNTEPDYAVSQLSQPTWFRRVVRSRTCQSISNAVLLTQEALPATPVTSGATICPGESAMLVASSPTAGGLLKWYDKPNGGKLLYEGSSYQTEPLLVTTDFFVQAESRNGCASTERVKASVTVRPSTANAGEDVTVVQGRFVGLTATGGNSYSWSPATGLSNPYIPNPSANPQTTTTYTVTVTSEFGCTYTDQVTVTVLPRIAPTNGITANGDNINDTWYIKNIEHYPSCHIQIFTRWGEKIYDSTGYREPWNGTHNGKPLPMAAYYYIIDVGMNEKPVSGSITLIK